MRTSIPPGGSRRASIACLPVRRRRDILRALPGPHGIPACPARARLYRFAAALIARRKLADGEFAGIESTIGRDGIAEVLVLLGYYTSVAMGMKVHEVPVPAAG